MTGLKITSMFAVLSSLDAIKPSILRVLAETTATDPAKVINGLPYEQFTAMGLAALCVWQMWKLIQRKDEQTNRLIAILETRPCTHGTVTKDVVENKE